ncbi:unnamed protein product [Prorocentrum cordatum]|uniref:NYN domain-containing protein n=1 Tax=Prorocentrum cordatum TaxID=2364126 RepID=A0ABN9VS89_9DINO|nr:unnamed protein product [Polarella glacialis]
MRAGSHDTAEAAVQATAEVAIQAGPLTSGYRGERDILQLRRQFQGRLQQLRSQLIPGLQDWREELLAAVRLAEEQAAELRQRCAEAEREGREEFERTIGNLKAVEEPKRTRLQQQREKREELVREIDELTKSRARAPSTGARVALLIDGDQPLGEMVVKRCYVTTSKARDWGPSLQDAGIDAVVVPRKAGGSKDPVDLEIALEAADLALGPSRPDLSALVIASNDVDLISVLRYVRTAAEQSASGHVGVLPGVDHT